MHKLDLSTVPNKTGCYLWKDNEGNVLYVGKANKLKSRMQSYLKENNNPKTKVLMSKVTNFDYILTNNEMDSLLLELNLITKHNPKYNIKLKSNKKFNYIKLTKEPKVSLSLTKNYKKDKNKYFGPFPERFSAYKVIKILKQIYPVNECKKSNLNKPCINYQLGLCLGYCIGKADRQKKEDLYNKLFKILNGSTKDLLKQMDIKLEHLSNKQRYEEARDIKENIELVKNYTNNQNIYFKDSINRDVVGYYVNEGLISISMTFIRSGMVIDVKSEIIRYFSIDHSQTIEQYLLEYYSTNIIPNELVINFDTKIAEKLNIKLTIPKTGTKFNLLQVSTDLAKEKLLSEGKIFKLTEETTDNALEALNSIVNLNIKDIEMVDISNLATKESVGGVVHFTNGISNKKYYRKFILETKRDDYYNIYEVTLRHFKKKIELKEKLPELFITDGKYQVNSAIVALRELNINNVKVIGLIKDAKHKTDSFFIDNKIINITNRDLKNILTHIQDEVHRYSISFLRKKTLKKLNIKEHT